MTMTEDPITAAGISEAAVRAKTGKGWAEWFAILDAFDVRTHGHTAAARYLATAHHPGDWWSQMITVAYERARGLREKHQTADGYEASASRTFAVPVETLFAAWQDEATRRRWLPKSLTVRTATPPKSLRIAWPDGTSVSVTFSAKGETRSVLQVQHGKLADAATVAERKAYWGEALERLRALLEPSAR